MPASPRRAGRLAVGLAAAALLLGACSSTGDEQTDAPAPTPSESSESSGTPSGEPSDDAAPGGSGGQADGQAYVALGDSYTAAPLVPPTDTADPCLRSEGNYPSLVAAELGYELTDVSCTGATSTSMIGVQRTRDGGAQPAQFDALGRGTDLVTIGIGGNDVELFTTVFQRCLPLAEEDPDGAPCAEELTGTPDDLLPAVRALDARIEAIVTGVRQRAPQAEVVVVTYPQLVPRQGTCEQLPLAAGDYGYVRRVNATLSEALASGARAADAEVVDLLALSRGHDICSDDPWVNGLETDPEAALALHPFAVEQEAVAEEIADLVG